MPGISIKTPQEIQCMREGGEMLAQVHGLLAAAVQPGVITQSLDRLAEEAICAKGGVPAFKGYRDFPYTICVSVNEEVVHGEPAHEQPLQEGDIVSIDCGVYYKDFYTDAAFTHKVGKVSPELLHLLAVGEEALYEGVAQARVGRTIGDIGNAIEAWVSKYRFSVVREYTGHGVGRALHEQPWVFNYGERGGGEAIVEGMVLAIEPIVNMGTAHVWHKGPWYVRTRDYKPSVHFEQTIAIVDGFPEVLTPFGYIKEAITQDDR